MLSPTSAGRWAVVEGESVNYSCLSNSIGPDDSISQTKSYASGRTASVFSKVKRNLFEPLAAELRESLSAVVELIANKNQQQSKEAPKEKKTNTPSPTHNLVMDDSNITTAFTTASTVTAAVTKAPMSEDYKNFSTQSFLFQPSEMPFLEETQSFEPSFSLPSTVKTPIELIIESPVRAGVEMILNVEEEHNFSPHAPVETSAVEQISPIPPPEVLKLSSRLLVVSTQSVVSSVAIQGDTKVTNTLSGRPTPSIVPVATTQPLPNVPVNVPWYKLYVWIKFHRSLHSSR